MIKDEALDAIEQAVRENRTSFKQLTLAEQRLISCYFLYNDEQALADADHGYRIQFAVAEFLYKGDAESLLALNATLNIAFITGDQNYEPHYADHIDTVLQERWRDLNRSPNEHFENDAMQRARDCKDEQNKHRH